MSPSRGTTRDSVRTAPSTVVTLHELCPTVGRRRLHWDRCGRVTEESELCEGEYEKELCRRIVPILPLWEIVSA